PGTLELRGAALDELLGIDLAVPDRAPHGGLGAVGEDGHGETVAVPADVNAAAVLPVPSPRQRVDAEPEPAFQEDDDPILAPDVGEGEGRRAVGVRPRRK